MLRNLVPKYAYIPLLSVLFVNMLVYYLPKPFVSAESAIDLGIGIDGALPFLSFFVVFYILAFAQWPIGHIIIARESREYCYRVAMADIIAKLICVVFFIAMPVSIVRPEIEGGGVFNGLARLLYFVDEPTNLFPSIHCLESYAVARCALPLKKVPIAYKVGMAALSLLVFASVVFVKQHFFLDIVAGILVFEIGLLITRLTKLDMLVFGRIKD